jgi:hypothetical protein
MKKDTIRSETREYVPSLQNKGSFAACGGFAFHIDTVLKGSGANPPPLRVSKRSKWQDRRIIPVGT